MKNFNLAEYRVSELTSDEMQDIIGGNWWTEFRDGFVEGFTWAFDLFKEALQLISAR